MPEYTFNHDWAMVFRQNATQLFVPMAEQPIQYLEVGLYEGMSACWMLDNVLLHPESRLTGIDWDLTPNGRANLSHHTAKTTILEGDSKKILRGLTQQYDIIYIDGGHAAKDVLFDTVLAWPLLKRGGIMLWDDYRRFMNDSRVFHAVNKFLECLEPEQYERLVDNYQLGVRKGLYWD